MSMNIASNVGERFSFGLLEGVLHSLKEIHVIVLNKLLNVVNVTWLAMTLS